MNLPKLARHPVNYLLDAVLLAGLAAIVYGLHEIWRPLGPLVGGLALVTVAILLRYRRK